MARDIAEAMRNYVHSSHRRLQRARQIADALHHDDELHRLAMTAVFALEDCHETFVRFQAELDGGSPTGSSRSSEVPT